MLRSAYPYNQKMDSKKYPVFPVMHEVHSEWRTIVLCDGGLVRLAEQLSTSIHVSWGDDYNGAIKIRNHAPPGDAVCFDIYPLSKNQIQEFSRALAKGIKSEWTDERETK